MKDDVKYKMMWDDVRCALAKRQQKACSSDYYENAQAYNLKNSWWMMMANGSWWSRMKCDLILTWH